MLYYFGLHLLDDPNAMQVHTIKQKHREMLCKSTPRSSKGGLLGGERSQLAVTLTEMLHDIGLCTLASEIGEVKLVSNTSL